MGFWNSGQIWTSSPTNFDWWEVELVFRVTGRGRIGADGLVILSFLDLLSLFHHDDIKCFSISRQPLA